MKKTAAIVATALLALGSLTACNNGHSHHTKCYSMGETAFVASKSPKRTKVTKHVTVHKRVTVHKHTHTTVVHHHYHNGC